MRLLSPTDLDKRTGRAGEYPLPNKGINSIFDGCRKEGLQPRAIQVCALHCCRRASTQDPVKVESYVRSKRCDAVTELLLRTITIQASHRSKVSMARRVIAGIGLPSH